MLELFLSIAKVSGMTISSKLLLENEIYGCSPTPTTCRFKTITQCSEFVFSELSVFETTTPYADTNLTGNVEEPRIYTKYILFVKGKKKTNCMLEYSFTGSD